MDILGGIVKKCYFGGAQQKSRIQFGQRFRTFRIEELEDRRLLSVCGMEPAAACITDSEIMASSLSESESVVPVILPVSGMESDPWDGTIDISWFNATTYEDTTNYTLSTAEQLAGLAAIVSNKASLDKAYSFSGKTITLGNNIDLNGRSWKPIGTYSTSFAGVFDGANYTISNLRIDADSISTHDEQQYVSLGLFSVNGDGAKIQNITLDSAIFDVDFSKITQKVKQISAGFVAGRMVTNDKGLVDNCIVKENSSFTLNAGSVPTESFHVGGLAGNLTGSVTNSSVSANVTVNANVKVQTNVGGDWLLQCRWNRLDA